MGKKQMRKNILVFLFTIAATVSEAREIRLDGGSVSFDAPDSFTELTKEEIAFKYPSNRAPAFVLGNDTRATTIAYDIKPHTIPEDKLGEVMASFEQTFNRIIPGIEWKKKEIIKKGGKEWICFEMTSRAIDTDIYNMMLVTPYKGKMLVINFNSTQKEFPQVEKELRKSMDSIKVVPIAEN